MNFVMYEAGVRIVAKIVDLLQKNIGAPIVSMGFRLACGPNTLSISPAMSRNGRLRAAATASIFVLRIVRSTSETA